MQDVTHSAIHFGTFKDESDFELSFKKGCRGVIPSSLKIITNRYKKDLRSIKKYKSGSGRNWRSLGV